MKSLFNLLLIIIFGFGGIFTVSSFLEKNIGSNENFADEDLYLSAHHLKLLGSDFSGLIADWYWINSLQYMGDKILNYQGEVNINDLRPLNPRLLYPMLDSAATLDPQFMTVYSYSAAILPSIDNEQAIKLLEKGITANPENWQLYHNLGYIHWQSKNYSKAAEAYSEGAKKKDAPIWMRQMSVNMQAQGGSRDFARQVYGQMYETAEDSQAKTFAELRFAQIQSLDQRDAIRSILRSFRQKNIRCINSWAEISEELRGIKLSHKTGLDFDKNGSPIDPTGVPYVLVNQNNECDVRLSSDSNVPPV